jgi:predicted aldo/keto reductase-like oxidoreductase
MKSFQLGRRRFLKETAAGALGVGLGTPGAWAAPGSGGQETGPAKIKEYRVLGRTGFKVSDLGAGSIADDGVLAAALDSGVNYIDSGESYPGHHRVISQAMRGRDRKSVFITTKLEPKEDLSRENFLRRTRKCLEEIRTEYVDCLMLHMPEKAALVTTEGFHAAMRELKAEGRVRFVGISHHGSFWYREPAETMEKVLLTEAEDGRFDVMLMAYNFLQINQAEHILEVCRAKNIGTAIMKSTPIATYYTMKARIEQLQKDNKPVEDWAAEGLRRYQDKADRAEDFIRKHNLRDPQEIQDAALRFVLGNPNVGTICGRVKTYDELERFVRLSGTRLDTADAARLDSYKEGCGELYCRHACGQCEPSCPQGVPVNTIMRYHQYFAAQSREKEAMMNYASIPGVKADACANCPGHCEAACPYHVPIQGMLIMAHTQLSMP